MIFTSFDRDDDLIVIEATIWGARSGRRAVRMALDTGSSETLIIPEVTDALGYGPHLGDRITVIRSVVGREQGYMMRVARFGALGFELSVRHASRG